MDIYTYNKLIYKYNGYYTSYAFERIPFLCVIHR